jgi:hypothetical protein
MFFETHAEASPSEDAEEEHGEDEASEGGKDEHSEASEESEAAEGPREMVGSSTSLRRSPDHIDYRVTVTELEPGHVYSLHAVVFNLPEECLGNAEHPQFRCSREDFLQGRGGYSAVNLSGKNLLEGTTISFRGRYDQGDLSRVLAGEGGLRDAMNAEIMFDLWDMGAPIPELLEQQLRTRNAGCGVGEPNDNGGLCVDLAGNAL